MSVFKFESPWNLPFDTCIDWSDTYLFPASLCKTQSSIRSYPPPLRVSAVKRLYVGNHFNFGSSQLFFDFGSMSRAEHVLAAFVQASNGRIFQSARKLHCRLSVVNDNQTVIPLLFLLNFLCGFGTVLAQLFSSKCTRSVTLFLSNESRMNTFRLTTHWPMYHVFTKSSFDHL